jgi:outer membrane protein TolC
LKQLSFLLGGGDFEPDLGKDTVLEELEVSDLLKKAYENNSDLKDYYDYELRIYKSYFVPDIYLGFQYDPLGTDYSPKFGVGLSFDVPLFNRKQGFAISYESQLKQVVVQIDKTIEKIR